MQFSPPFTRSSRFKVLCYASQVLYKRQCALPKCHFFASFTIKIPAINMTNNTDDVVAVEWDLGLVSSSCSGDARIEALTQNVERKSNMIADLARAVSAEPSEFLLDDTVDDPTGTSSVFDPAESLTQEITGKSLDEAELANADLYKDSEDCGPPVAEGVAKRINRSCTKRPAKEQFLTIQKKYLRPQNCEFLKAPRVNPELWDDLLDKTKNLKHYQKNLIKGIIPVIMLSNQVVKAKQEQNESIPVSQCISGGARSLSGGLIFIYSCSQTLKTMDFKRN